MHVSRQRAVLAMVLITLLWSTAGVVTRQLEAARGFEITFWRSLSLAIALPLLLAALRGPRAATRILTGANRAVWMSGLCWSVMFTAFMLALALTTVANVLVTMATGPLITALLARTVLRQHLGRRTVIAGIAAGIGIGVMYGAELESASPRQWLGTGIAFLVPLAGAINWILINHAKKRALPVDFQPALLIGAWISAAAMAPFAYPFGASGHDIALLASLGVFQLAIPCLLVVRVAAHLSAPEVSLLCLLEVLFGVAWVWLAADEAPEFHTVVGGSIVLSALAASEWASLRRRTQLAGASA